LHDQLHARRLHVLREHEQYARLLRRHRLVAVAKLFELERKTALHEKSEGGFFRGPI